MVIKVQGCRWGLYGDGQHWSCRAWTWLFIGSSYNIEGNEWCNGSGNMSKCKEILFQRGLSENKGSVGG